MKKKTLDKINQLRRIQHSEKVFTEKLIASMIREIKKLKIQNDRGSIKKTTQIFENLNNKKIRQATENALYFIKNIRDYKKVQISKSTLQRSITSVAKKSKSLLNQISSPEMNLFLENAVFEKNGSRFKFELFQLANIEKFGKIKESDVKYINDQLASEEVLLVQAVQKNVHNYLVFHAFCLILDKEHTSYVLTDYLYHIGNIFKKSFDDAKKTEGASIGNEIKFRSVDKEIVAEILRSKSWKALAKKQRLSH